MGITAIGMSAEERALRDLTNARRFTPIAKQLLVASSSAKCYLKQLERTRGTKEIHELLHGVYRELTIINSLCKGYNAMLQPYGLPELILVSRNHLSSLLDTIYSHGYGKLRSEVTSITEKTTEVFAVIATIVKAHDQLKKSHLSSKEPSSNDGLDISRLAAYSEYESQTPAYGEKLVSSFSLPLMMTFNRMVTAEYLNSKNLVAENISGYTVLTNCLLIGMNDEQVIQQNIDEAALLQDSMMRIGKVLGEKVFLVSEDSTRYKGWKYYWLGTSSYLKVLRGTDIDNQIVVTSFQFPFAELTVKPKDE